MNARVLVVAGILAMLFGVGVIVSISMAPPAAPHVATDTPPNSPSLINSLPSVVIGIGIISILLGVILLALGVRSRMAARSRSRKGVS